MSRTRATSPGTEARSDRRFVTALARGLEVLHSFRPNDRWLAHQELVRRTGLPHATISRLTFTLVALGYLRHRPAVGEYALSPAVLALGFSMLSTFDIGRAARPLMQALADRARAAVSLGVRHQLSMIYVAHCRSTARLTLGLDVGTRLPLAITAMGRAVLCAVSDAERDRLSRQLQAQDPQAWPAVRNGLARAAEMYAGHGLVDSVSDWDKDIAAIGVPVDIGAGKEPFGLTIGGPASQLQGSHLYEELGAALKETGAEVSHVLSAASWHR